MIFTESSLALATWALVAVTFGVAWRQSKAIRTDLRARFQLTFIDRFDGSKLVKARKDLSRLFLDKATRDQQIDETVMDFFEDMGLFLRRSYLDAELLRSTFGFYAVRWWEACKGYIVKERGLQSDSTLFSDFESLAKRFSDRDAKEGLKEPTRSDVERFLEDERDLQ
jgi:hypothetical protein